MAGITGTAMPGARRAVRRSLGTISHRGGSYWRIVEHSLVTLGEIRPNSGRLLSEKESQCPVVCDGSIYNWQALSGQAIDAVEAIHELYLDMGPSFVSELDGSFALAIGSDDGLFLARDPLGITPIYYGLCDGVVCFASEMKALLDWVEDVREFPPGHFMSPSEGLVQYCEIENRPARDVSPDKAAIEVRSRLTNAVAKCVADGDNLGSWLSGGLDSSAMAVLADMQMPQIETFAVGVDGAPDLMHARTVAESINAKHHELTVTADDMIKVLPDVIYHLESFDALLVRSSITNFLVGKLASEHVDSVLSGEGGDELFAGYSYLKKLDPPELTDELIDITGRLHNTALQRVDRCSSAHGLTVYTPFLDQDVVNYAFSLPPEYKIHRDERTVEKWILRKAMDGLLPDEVLHRPKEKFWEGAGVKTLIEEHAEAVITDSEFEQEQVLPDDTKLNTKEELYYYRVFKEHFGDVQDLSFVGRSKGAPVR